MAVAFQTLIEEALRRIQPAPAREALPSLRTALTLMLPAALARATSEVMAAGDVGLLNALKRSFPLTAVAGVADLTTALASGLAPDALREAEVYHASSTYPAGWVPDRAALALAASVNDFRFTHERNDLHLTDPATGTTGSLAGDVTLKAVAVPQADSDGAIDIPVRLEAWLVETLARMAGTT